MEALDALLQSNVKVDAATNKGSVIGLLKVLTGQTSSDSSKTLQRITAVYPELGARCPHLRINGKGKETPVADAATLVEIVFVVGPAVSQQNMSNSDPQTRCDHVGTWSVGT